MKIKHDNPQHVCVFLFERARNEYTFCLRARVLCWSTRLGSRAHDNRNFVGVEEGVYLRETIEVRERGGTYCGEGSTCAIQKVFKRVKINMISRALLFFWLILTCFILCLCMCFRVVVCVFVCIY